MTVQKPSDVRTPSSKGGASASTRPPIDRSVALFCALVILAFVGAAGYFSSRDSTYYDEGCSMTSARGSLGDSVGRAVRMEGQPPLYFLLLNLWLRAHPSIGFARVFSIVAAVVAVLLTVRAFARLFREPPRLLYPVVLIILCANPFTMFVATEARGYALQLALGAGLASVMTAALARGFATRSDLVTIIALGSALGYINYLAGLAAATVTVALLIAGTISRRQAFLIGVGGAALTAPLLGWVRVHFQSHASTNGSFSLSGAVAVARGISHLAIPRVMERGPWQAILVACLAVAALISYRLRRGTLGSLPSRPFFLAAGLTVVIFAAVGFVGGATVAEERYLAAYLPIIWLATLLFLRSSLGWTVSSVLCLGCAVAGAFTIARVESTGIRMGDWRHLAERIAQAPPPALPVYVYPPVEALSVRVEVGDVQRVEAFPNPYDGSGTVTFDDFVISDEEAVRARIARRVGGGSFWLAFTTSPIAPPQLRDPLATVRNFIGRSCTVENTYEFSGSRLLLLRLKNEQP